jgi:4-carboxymuconolactone decarboxylase
VAEAMFGRVPWLGPDDFDAEQHKIYDGITLGRRSAGDGKRIAIDAEGRMIGPFNVMLQSPALGNYTQEVGASIRFDTELSDRVRELAILEVARARRCDFEWIAHSRSALAYGLTADDVAAVLAGGPLELAADEAVAREVVLALLSADDLDDDLYARAEAALGIRVIYELMVLVGYYSLVSTSMRIWRTPLLPGMEPVF